MSRKLFILLLFAGQFFGHAEDKTAGVSLPDRSAQIQAAYTNILAIIPKGWTTLSKTNNQERYGDSDKYFQNSQVKSFVLISSKPIYVAWEDKNGSIHVDSCGMASMGGIWIVPDYFKPPFPSLWHDHPPVPNELIYSSKGIKIYCFSEANENGIFITNRLNPKLVVHSEYVHCNLLDKPTWPNWKKDIRSKLDAVLVEP